MLMQDSHFSSTEDNVLLFFVQNVIHAMPDDC